ncbi:MAG: PAS domain-containing sensor histidine kinase [Ignavibacteria bacterium]|jgi:PAS domain S-box-containing protein|nr:PAS domain-containing sensor histidine kinase [Ignavibacteria bacterium]
MNRIFIKLYKTITEPLALALLYLLVSISAFTLIIVPIIDTSKAFQYYLVMLILAAIIYIVSHSFMKRITASEKRYRTVVENTRDTIWKYDIQTDLITFMTDAQTEITGIPAQEYVGKPMSFVFTPASSQQSIYWLKKRLNGEQTPFAFEVQEYKADGSLVWCEISAHIATNSKGVPTEIVGITREIEDRKRLEAQIKESQERYKLIAENTADCIWTMDFNTMMYTFMSDSIYNITGFTRKEYLGKTFFDNFFPQEYVDLAMKLIAESGKNFIKGDTDILRVIYDAQAYHKDGSLVWVGISVRAIINEYGEIVELLGITRKIEHRKKLEAQLRESERRYRVVAENTKEATWTMDLATMRYTYMSENVVELAGYTAEEYMQMSIQDALPPESIAICMNHLHTQLGRFAEGKCDVVRAAFELQQYHKGGYLTWVEISACAIPGENRSMPTEIFAVTRNINERKESEAQLYRQQEELRLLNATKDKFFSIIAHDLKNPLTALINIAEVFSAFFNTMTSQEIESNIKILLNSAQHIHKLLDNLLQWSRSSTGQIQYNLEKRNVIELAISVTTYLRTQALVKNISLNVHCKNIDGYYVQIDVNMIETVMRNIISNAIKFTNEFGIIRVDIGEYSADKDYVLVAISDTGVGMDADKINKLFKIGEQVTTKGTSGEIGTGLGLILVKEFIAKHNSKIWVESEVDKGTTFFFTLPLQ